MIIIARFKKPPCNFLPPLNIIRKSHNEEKFSPLSEIGSNFEIWCDKWPLPHLARCSIWFNTQGVCLREIDSTSKVLLFFASTLCCFTTLANNRNKFDCFTILQKKWKSIWLFHNFANKLNEIWLFHGFAKKWEEIWLLCHKIDFFAVLTTWAKNGNKFSCFTTLQKKGKTFGCFTTLQNKW